MSIACPVSSIYPFREYAGNTVSTRADSGDALIARMSHPKVAGILFEQLKNVLCHLRVVASQYGASEVTHIRYVLTKEDTTGMVIPGARVGKISAIIVQQVQETPTGPIRTQPMDENKPCREYAQYTLPERLNSPPIVYEILIERPT